MNLDMSFCANTDTCEHSKDCIRALTEEVIECSEHTGRHISMMYFEYPECQAYIKYGALPRYK
jgi:hypothetical protein